MKNTVNYDLTVGLFSLIGSIFYENLIDYDLIIILKAEVDF